MKITTPEEWWAVLEDNWEDLLDTASIYLDLSAPAERNGFPLVGGTTVLQDMVRCKKNRSNWYELRSYLNKVWAVAPDRPEIHSHPAWDVLCSLLSEDWVFHKDRGAVIDVRCHEYDLELLQDEMSPEKQQLLKIEAYIPYALTVIPNPWPWIPRGHVVLRYADGSEEMYQISEKKKDVGRTEQLNSEGC